MYVKNNSKLLENIDESLLEIVDSLTVSKINFREDKTMEKLEQAEQKLSKLTDRDVWIVYLPPSWVAASHYVGNEPEHHAAAVLDKFVIESGLQNIKPDLREYGFNHSNPGFMKDVYGYEFWVTIPEDFDVPAPLEKKYFEGGLYGAHMIPMGAFEEWGWLWEWAHNNDKYDADIKKDGGECMNGLLEEHLNYRNNVSRFINGRYDDVQLDLLIPIKGNL